MSNLCACLGLMYGEPYCYCEMKRKGLDVDSNPLRIVDEDKFKASVDEYFKRMEDALQSPGIEMLAGLTREQKRDYIILNANNVINTKTL